MEDGDPPLTFVWTKDGNLATSVPGVQMVSHALSSLLTIHATSSIHSGIYSCKAINPVSWSMMTIKIYVNGSAFQPEALNAKPLRSLHLLSSEKSMVEVIGGVRRNYCLHKIYYILTTRYPEVLFSWP